MTATQKQTLFNDPTLSDVKIKQISNGKTREYFAHKAVLCGQSDFFLKAFTGGFKEATETFIEIHDDNPENFEFALKFMYTQKYDISAIETLVGKNDTLKRAKFSMGVHIVADKYDIQRLIRPARSDVQDVSKKLKLANDLAALITVQYRHCEVPGNLCALGIVSTLFQSHHDFTLSAKFAELVQRYPVFASDMMSVLVRFQCWSCKQVNVAAPVFADAATRQTNCTYCGIKCASKF